MPDPFDDQSICDRLQAAMSQWRTKEQELRHRDRVEIPGEHRLLHQLIHAVKEMLADDACREEAVKARCRKAAQKENQRIRERFTKGRKVKQQLVEEIASVLCSEWHFDKEPWLDD